MTCFFILSFRLEKLFKLYFIKLYLELKLNFCEHYCRDIPPFVKCSILNLKYFCSLYLLFITYSLSLKANHNFLVRLAQFFFNSSRLSQPILQFKTHYSMRVTLNVYCCWHRGNMAGESFNMNSQSGYPSSHTLRPNSEIVNPFQESYFHI